MTEKKEIKKEEVKVEAKEQSMNLIEKANLVALRQEEANTELAKLLDRQEAMQVESRLGGVAEAGAEPVVKTKEDILNESAKAMLKGTGYDEILFPEKKEGE